MTKRHSLLPAILVFFALITAPAFAIHDYPAESFWQDSNEQNNAVIDHSIWQTLLDQYLRSDNPSGIHLFDYAQLQQDGADLLDRYLFAMSNVAITEHSKAEQFAYWVNLYNAATVKLIVDAYPVKSIMKLGKGWFSIGPWDDDVIEVQGKTLSLNDIEHRILRPIWQDYRIHFVVNCASLGCPSLYPDALTAQNSEVILTAAVKSFLQHPRGFSFENDRLVLSKIFKWYRKDFGDDQATLLNTLKPYLSEKDKASLDAASNLRVRYQYDWDLNNAD